MKSLHPAFNAPSLSAGNDEAVSATMMTGPLCCFFPHEESSFSPRSMRLISFVASKPPITGMPMSMNIRWNLPAFHLLTASRPLAAVSHRTLSCCICFDTTRDTSELSSAIKTLIGGIAPSSCTSALGRGTLGGASGFGGFGGLSVVVGILGLLLGRP
jgi:hypothetical protein